MKVWICFFLFFCPLFVDAKCQCVDGEGCLKGIILIDAKESIDDVPRVEGIHIEVKKIDLEGIQEVLTPYLCSKLDQERVQNIKNAILDFLTQRALLAMVIIPEQEVSDGIIAIEILTATVEDIHYEGQHWFSKDVIQNQITMKEGQLLDQNALLNDLAFINLNPFLKTKVILLPGDEPGSTDVEFLTQDRFPFYFFAGADNNGIVSTSAANVFAGFNWGNAFGIGDVMSYQYTASPDFHNLQTHVFVYTSNLPWKDILTLYASYGQIYPDIADFRSEGKTAQASGRYKWLLQPLYRPFKSQVEFGFDYKYLNSNLFFTSTTTEVPITIQSINITQWEGAYTLTDFWGPHQITYRIEAYASLWKDLFPDQTDSAYQALRPNSSVRYAYLRQSLGYRYMFWDDWSLFLYLGGQAATGPLPSSEQYSLGGFDSIRGYEQSQFLADNAVSMNFEFYFPTIETKGKIKSRTTFLVFYDVGYGKNYQPASPEFSDQFLSGAGPALRFEVEDNFSLTADYGFMLHQIPGYSSMGRFYLTALFGY